MRCETRNPQKHFEIPRNQFGSYTLLEAVALTLDNIIPLAAFPSALRGMILALLGLGNQRPHQKVWPLPSIRRR